MINLSNEIVFLKSEGELINSSKKIIEKFLGLAVDHERFPSDYNESRNRQKRKRHSFYSIFSSPKMQTLTRRAVELLYILGSNDKANSPTMKQSFHELTGRNASFDADIEGLRVFSRAILIKLWAEGHVLLTPRFNRNGVEVRFPGFLKETDCEIFSNATSHSAPLTVERNGRDVCYTMSWKRVDQIDWDTLWSAIPLFVTYLREEGIKPAFFPLVGLVRAISECNPDAVSPSQSKLLSAYHASQSNISVITPSSQEEYKALSELSSSMRGKRRRGAKERVRIDKRSRGPVLLRSIDDILKPLPTIRPPDISWLKNGWYIGREHVDVEELSRQWVPVITAYYNQVRSEKPRSFKNIRGDLNVLWDYVFCYLPWWLENNSDSKINLPRAIDEFNRVFFWKRVTESDHLPRTAMSMYLARRSKVTVAHFVRSCFDFFDFAIKNRQELTGLYPCSISADFTNPIDKEDSPGSGPRQPSDKLALPFNCIAFIRAYFYFLEEIGTALQGISLDESSRESILKNSKRSWIDLADFGMVSSFDFISEGAKYCCKVDKVPNVFNWHFGDYKAGDGAVKTTVPWLSCLRMLMADFFAGQRVQNFQWLNLDTFDLNYSPQACEYYTLVKLEHDKTLPGRIIRLQTSILEILLKEKNFQLNIYNAPPGYVYYENHVAESHEPFRALFRSPWAVPSKLGSPFSDNAYSQIWLRFLAGVNFHFNETVDVDLRYQFFDIEGDESTSAEEENLDYKKIKTKHTPHSIRNTYITWMLDLVELDILMGQVGHKSVTVTLHYATPGQQHIDQQLELADRAVMASKNMGSGIEILSGSVIKPSHPGSTLSQSVRENLSGAIHDQGMFSVDSENIICKESGLTLLRRLPATSFAIFNHCICPLGGFCPKEVLSVANAPHRCGICPIAVFSIDNAEAIEAQRRKLQRHMESLKAHLEFLKGRNEPNSSIKTIERDLKITGMELLGYSATIHVIRKKLHEASSSEINYLVREPEMLKKAAALTSDYEDVGMRMISRLADANAFPEYATPDYLIQLNRQLRNLSLDSQESAHDPVNIAIEHVRNYVQLHGISLQQLAGRGEIMRLISAE